MRAILVLVVVLAGCASPEQIRQQQEAQQAQYLAALTGHCNSFGFRSGTTEHSQCMQAAHQQEQQRIAYERQMRHNNAMQALGAAAIINQQSQPYTLPSNTINCTTYQRGPYGNINCF
jgi:hypothetical protein